VILVIKTKCVISVALSVGGKTGGMDVSKPNSNCTNIPPKSKDASNMVLKLVFLMEIPAVNRYL
jgi:hypothetical protein